MIDQPTLERVLIDIPIGLSSGDFPRTLEKKLRKELSPRGSTVFNPPCQEALYQKNQERAKEINTMQEGKSLSMQTLNIMPKIKELDEFVHEHRDIHITESHPEFCFKYLNHGKVLMSKKSTTEGQMERKNILANYDPSLIVHGETFIKKTLRSMVKVDDVWDAACLGLVAKMSLSLGLNYLEDDHQYTKKGIPIRIGYCFPPTSI